MTELLIRLFVKDYNNVKSEKVRIRYGILSGTVGIILNAMLSVSKMLFGIFSKSIAVVADGVNNLFDAVSSVINLIGFKISGKPADKEHPFGHGRVEYVSALTLAFFILITAIELVKGSIDKLRHPEAVIFSIPAVIVLIFSILGKIWLAYFNTKIGKKINSLTVNAVVTDSISDVATTTCSLIALVVSGYTRIPVDALMGIAVALVVMYAGIGIIKDTLGPLLGEPPSTDIVDKLHKLVMSYESVIGIHDLVLHSYGNSKVIGSLHAEVPDNCGILEIHDTIDLIERQIREELGIEISIHMDPVSTDDKKTAELKKIIVEIVKSIDEKITIHDFRIVDSISHTNLIFDIVLPFNSKLTEQEAKEKIEALAKEKNKNFFTVITVDRIYV